MTSRIPESARFVSLPAFIRCRTDEQAGYCQRPPVRRWGSVLATHRHLRALRRAVGCLLHALSVFPCVLYLRDCQVRLPLRSRSWNTHAMPPRLSRVWASPSRDNSSPTGSCSLSSGKGKWHPCRKATWTAGRAQALVLLPAISVSPPYPIARPGSKSPVIACRKDQRIIPDIDKGDKAMSRGYGDNIQMETMLRGRR